MKTLKEFLNILSNILFNLLLVFLITLASWCISQPSDTLFIVGLVLLAVVIAIVLIIFKRML